MCSFKYCEYFFHFLRLKSFKVDKSFNYKMLFVDSFMHFTSHKILHCQCTEKEVELIEFLYSSYLSNEEVLFKCATVSFLIKLQASGLQLY